jgi:hypothetical protein
MLHLEFGSGVGSNFHGKMELKNMNLELQAATKDYFPHTIMLHQIYDLEFIE